MAQKVLMIAAPNGVGKTTMALELISRESWLYDWVNADEIC